MSSQTRFKKRWFFLVLGALTMGAGFWAYSTPPATVMLHAPEIQEAKAPETQSVPSYAGAKEEDRLSPVGLEVEKGNRLPASN